MRRSRPSGSAVLVAGVVAALVGCGGGAPVPSPAYRDLVLRDKPLAYWPLDEATGGTAHDASGNDFHGTYKHVRLGAPGATKSHRAADFDRGTVELPPDAVFKTIAGDFTVEGWLSVRSFAVADVGCGNAVYGNDTLLAFGGAKDFECGVAAPAGLFFITIKGRTAYSSPGGPGPIPDWTHVAFERFGSTYQFFVNGELNTSGMIASVPIEIAGAARQLGLGFSGESSSPFIGSFHDVAVYARALTPDQIRERVALLVAEHEQTTLVDRLVRWVERRR
jgi:hypothetical protein